MFSFNPDFASTPSDTVSPGPRVGFLQSMAVAHDAAVSGTEGFINNQAYDQYVTQRSQLMERGEAMPNVMRMNGDPANPEDIAAYYENGDETINSQQLRDYDSKIEATRAKYPDMQLKTSKQIWDDTKAEYKRRNDLENERRGTTMGAVGGFIGGVAGGINPKYNPLNFLTAPIGGEALGATKVVGKVVGEGVVQGAVESVNEATGQRSARKLLGGDASLESSLENVGGAFVGGVVLKGAHEAIGGVVHNGRRWFGDSPNDPAPPVPEAFSKPPEPDAPLTPEQQYAIQRAMPEHIDPELASTRMGVSRILDDASHIRDRLEAWDGESPIDIKPRTDTAIPGELPEGVKFSDDLTTRTALDNLTLDEKARQLDPDTFRVYDGLAQKRADLRAELATAKPDTTNDFANRITEANNKVSDLTAQIGQRKLSPQKRTALTKQRDTAMADRDNLMAIDRATDTPRHSDLRDQLQKADYKMRDMAPIVGRAYERARGEFGRNPELREAVSSMVNERRPGIKPHEAEAIVNKAQESYPETSSQGPTVSRIKPENLKPNESVIHAAQKVIKEDVKVKDEALEKFKDSLPNVLKEKNGNITIGKHEFHLDDTIHVPNIDGEGTREISVRQLLDELNESEFDLKAMKTCSI